MFSAAYAMLTAKASHPTLADTQAGRLASRLSLGDFLVALDARVRAEVRTEFVLGAELLYRELCGGVGPAGALVVAAAQASCGREASELSEDAAVCVELLHLYANLLSRVTVDTGEQGKANNALALMIGDYGLSRAILAAAKVGPTFSQWFGDAIVATCEGLARIMQYRLGSEQATDRYMDSVRLLRGTSYSLAAKIGASLANADQPTVNALGAAGASLGVAVQICEDILALTRTDPVTGWKPQRTLQEGMFGLPVILAANDEPRIASLLREAKEGQDWEGALDAIRQGEGVARARELCRRYAADAKAATVAATGKEGRLVEVCDLPPRCLAPLSLLTSDEPHEPRVTGDVSPLRLAS
jgi:geranylgeranyl pyrophosphate synthase